MSSKKCDPLWAIVDEEVALQGSETDQRASCPFCFVTVQLKAEAKEGDRFACGLCGGVSAVSMVSGGLQLVKAP